MIVYANEIARFGSVLFLSEIYVNDKDGTGRKMFFGGMNLKDNALLFLLFGRCFFPNSKGEKLLVCSMILRALL